MIFSLFLYSVCIRNSDIPIYEILNIFSDLHTCTLHKCYIMCVILNSVNLEYISFYMDSFFNDLGLDDIFK